MTPKNADALIDDRPQDKVFGVDRSVFTDEAVFQDELRLIFEGTWVFVGLETQLPRPHSFFTTHIGRQPVLVMRDGEDKIGAFLNTCRHRGLILCPFRRGDQKFHTCRYHGWTYDSSGRNALVTDRQVGQYTPRFAQLDHDLVRVPRLAGYRGLLFASLNPDVPDLEEHLDEARTFIDLVLDQSPVGQVEFVPGDVTYTFQGNWKLQFENGLDFYHFQSTHSAYLDIVAKRFAEGTAGALSAEPEQEAPVQGSFNFRHGHAVNWSIKNTDNASGRKPLRLEVDAVRARVGATRAKWMLRQRNLTIFPNLQIIDVQSMQLRTWRPLAVGVTEITSHCLGIVGESAEARRLRIRNYEDFFNPTGLASSDDNLMFEYCQDGYAAEAGPTQGYERGLASRPDGAADYAAELGISPVESAVGELFFGGEMNFLPGYREWRRLLSRGRNR